MDEAEVDLVIKNIRNAWKACSKDYTQFKINGESCLQSALYFHLRRNLDNNYTILTEVYAGLPEENTKGKSHNRIDIIICKAANDSASPPIIALAGIEIKYCPKGVPKPSGIHKDLHSLSDLRNVKIYDKRIKILFKRHSTQYKSAPTELRLHTHAKVLLGIFCKDDEKIMKSKTTFWKHYRPTEGRWDSRNNLPPRLGVLIARASKDNTVDLDFWGSASLERVES